MRRVLILALALAPGLAAAGTVTATRLLPAGSIIAPGDVASSDARGPASALSDPADALGQQARVTLYPGRPITAAALQTPLLVARNQIVRIGFAAGSLRIEAEGRALGAGAAGAVIPVLNTASRQTVSARINPDGTLSALQ